MMSQHEILEKIRKDGNRLIALGVSKERQDDYYSHLSIDCTDRDADERAFANATAGLDLPAEDQTFVKRVLDLGDGR
jgi:hypothetical protein